MKKQFLLFTAVTSILGIQLAHADVLPPDQKPIPVCSYIQGMENFPKLTFLTEEYSPSGAPTTFKEVQKNDCIEVGYKFNTIKLYAVNTDQYLKISASNTYLAWHNPSAYAADKEIQAHSKLVPLADKTEYEHYYYRIDGVDNTAKLLKLSFSSKETNLMVSDTFPKPVTGLDSEILNTQSSYASPFKDINDDNSYRTAVNYLREKGIINGYSDGTFRPNNKINRAEFTKIVMEAGYNLETIEREKPVPSYDGFEAPFKDIPLNETAWYADYINWAAAISLIQGYSDGTFRPNQEINFVEAAKILKNAFKLTRPNETSVLIAYPWYYDATVTLQIQKAIPVTITHFDQKITRGEMAEMIYRLMTGNKNLPSQTYTDLN